MLTQVTKIMLNLKLEFSFICPNIIPVDELTQYSVKLSALSIKNRE